MWATLLTGAVSTYPWIFNNWARMSLGGRSRAAGQYPSTMRVRGEGTHE